MSARRVRPTPQSSGRVLVVEPNARLRGRLIDLLEEAGLHVRTATCADGARAAVAQRWPQVVVVGARARGNRDVIAFLCERSRAPMVVLGAGGAHADTRALLLEVATAVA